MRAGCASDSGQRRGGGKQRSGGRSGHGSLRCVCAMRETGDGHRRREGWSCLDLKVWVSIFLFINFSLLLLNLSGFSPVVVVVSNGGGGDELV